MSLAPLFDLPLLTVILLIAIMCLAGLIHGTLGLGFPMIATPLLSLMFDVRTAILITLLPTVAVNLASIIKGGNWRQNIGQYWLLPVYAVIGGLLGTWLIVDHDPAPYKMVLALLILLYLGTARFSGRFFNWIRQYPKMAMLGFGLVAGVAAGSTNVMVPILIIYTLGLGMQPTAMIQLFNLTFLSGKVAQMVVFGAGGYLDQQWLLSTTPLALVGLAALLIGMKIRDRIPTDTFRLMIRLLLVIIAITLIAQYMRYAMT